MSVVIGICICTILSTYENSHEGLGVFVVMRGFGCGLLGSIRLWPSAFRALHLGLKE